MHHLIQQLPICTVSRCRYWAPEVEGLAHNAGAYDYNTFTADVWSVGAVCFELLLNRPLYGELAAIYREGHGGRMGEEMWDRLVGHKKDEFYPQLVDSKSRDFLARMLAPAPHRATLAQLMNPPHAFLAG